MPKRRRQYVPGRVYQVTTRTVGEELWLRPCPVVNAIILGVLARAMHLFPQVNVHSFVALSNHMHMLLSAQAGNQLAKFIAFVNGNIARRINGFYDRPGPLWSRRATVIPVVGDAAIIERLHYELSQGCKEGLVAAPRLWPGASAYRALDGDMTMTGVWHDRDGERRKARTGKPYDPAAFRHTYPIKLAPIPPFAGLSTSALRAKHRALIEQVEVETRRTNRREKRQPLGVAAVLAQDPSSRPASSKRSPAPLCHAASARERDAYREEDREFQNAYARAAEAVRAGEPRVQFPPGSFPRAGQWVAFAPTL